ncbi:GntR family transcriptional regulator [Cryobacterium sp. Y62]|uniref:GntR family transcriptional regulator n=1 Tax=Cryobacterium sp. Y62 TaxID=2048284 RepID=UPI000CE44F00|nr:GntR family transcriptional regulator [Cryobacterium sp. Y62]
MASRRPSTRARPQLSDEASGYVRGMIMSGELPPGMAVRAETIGAALGISTTPAREALQALRVEGFLELVPRRGFQVAVLTGQDVRDLFTVQALIAGELAARAAVAATPEDLSELEALHHELIAASARGNLELLEEKNHAFHREINLIAGAPKIIWALGLMTRYVPRKFYSSIAGWPEATANDHAQLLADIRSHDAQASRVDMQAHVEHAGELLAVHFDERTSAAAVDVTAGPPD